MIYNLKLLNLKHLAVIMNVLTESRIFRLFRKSVSADVSQKTFATAYNDFADVLLKSNFKSEDCFPKRFSRTSDAIAELSELRRTIENSGWENRPKHLCYFLTKTTMLLESHLHILEMEVQFPVNVKCPPTYPKDFEPISNLKWSENFTKRDLIELITALDHLGAVQMSTGDPASFKTIVSAFEVLFNVTLNYPHQQREDIVARKIKTTHFIGKMANAVVERSQK